MLEIVYQDREIVVLIKPVGLEAEQGVPRALSSQLGGMFYPVHRLDLNVGGVMVYARTRQAAASLSRAVQEGTMVKEYLARVHGVPPEEGDWEDLLLKDAGRNKVYVVKRMRAGVKRAHLTYRRLSEGETSLVRIRLYTGRSHQIRVQFASRGYPLVGDHKYGARDEEHAPKLWSCCLTFPHRGEERRYEALPDWAKGEKAET